MGLHLVTGHAGKAHISAIDTASFNAGLFGKGTYIFPGSSTFEITVESNNRVYIHGGEMMIQGRYIRMPYGETAPIDISNGTSGMNRIDLIVIRYLNDLETGIETVEFGVVEGEPTDGVATIPEYKTGDLLSGGCSIHEEPLYKIPINGLAIGTPEKMFEVFTPGGEVANDGVTYTRTLKLKRMFGEREEVGGLFPSAYPIRDGGNEDRTFAITRMVDGSAESMLFFNRFGLGLYDVIDDRYSYFARIRTGTYIGDAKESKFIDTDFTPSAVILTREDGATHIKEERKWVGGVATKENSCAVWIDGVRYPVISIENGGFRVYSKSIDIQWIMTNSSSNSYNFVALK